MSQTQVLLARQFRNFLCHFMSILYGPFGCFLSQGFQTKWKYRENLHPAIQAQNFLCSYPKDPELGSCRNPTRICGLLSTQNPFFSYKVFISLWSFSHSTAKSAFPEVVCLGFSLLHWYFVIDSLITSARVAGAFFNHFWAAIVLDLITSSFKVSKGSPWLDIK